MRTVESIIKTGDCAEVLSNYPDKGDYLKLCGQRFWEFISGDEDLYTDIIEPLGHKAKEKNDEFSVEYTKAINKFTLEFSREYCAPDGAILWKKLVQLNSGKKAGGECPTFASSMTEAAFGQS